ncbi:MAG: hypothetical protein A2Z42_04955 [Candidatus Woykebacteria bacterium RBG_19FT_COMBO_43_10]|uniref:Uncharacterized protein n=1 Tax=Candidatus Woykebacteria bacterium RBG_19FT_COMBO_43_10 TaxID=1802598 RepID=A0A1G1WJT8_9BACT|nr:MAG: hypothetical protein A2Z42_04955 [Candidatus Woykebacteria bacterium RBG_19FT_COMBO_43_10]
MLLHRFVKVSSVVLGLYFSLFFIFSAIRFIFRLFQDPKYTTQSGWEPIYVLFLFLLTASVLLVVIALFRKSKAIIIAALFIILFYLFAQSDYNRVVQSQYHYSGVEIVRNTEITFPNATLSNPLNLWAGGYSFTGGEVNRKAQSRVYNSAIVFYLFSLGVLGTKFYLTNTKKHKSS